MLKYHIKIVTPINHKWRITCVLVEEVWLVPVQTSDDWYILHYIWIMDYKWLNKYVTHPQGPRTGRWYGAERGSLLFQPTNREGGFNVPGKKKNSLQAGKRRVSDILSFLRAASSTIPHSSSTGEAFRDSTQEWVIRSNSTSPARARATEDANCLLVSGVEGINPQTVSNLPVTPHQHHSVLEQIGHFSLCNVLTEWKVSLM